MRTFTKLAIAAASALALGAAGTLALTAPSEADQPGWHDSVRGMVHSASHRMMRGMHGGFGMGMGRGMMIDHMFDMADLDGDGTISRDELEEAIAGWVAQHDADGDGTLSLEEYEGLFLELIRPLMVRSFQFLDRDGSGAVSADDIERPLGRMFDRIDRAGEGMISRDDLRRMHRDGWREMRRDRRERYRERREERREMRRMRRDWPADSE